MSAPVGQEAIRGLLPQRFPLLLVDRVVEVRPDGIVAEKAVTAAEWCYAGLDETAPPEAYAYPVALLLESFGQAAALAWFLRAGAGVPGPGSGLLPLFVGVRELRLSGAAYPGDVLRHDVRLDKVVDGAAVASGTVTVGGRTTAVIGELIAAVRPGAALAERG
ncbi:3-hydroxyacyl-ACP dehydratase FabZ family protein [Micromonospora aurantiaca]|uniref:3-hydroxyacyl-ACP dehydratase FabZ family protein n=1 Tax=Micromonospora aurantiaca (nom. illeg.) TaxID=47850 RepID=UPI00380C708B